MFTNIQLVEFCQAVYKAAWVYWYGTCGYKCTESLYNSKAKQYPSHYTAARKSGYMADIKAGKMCADCVGMIKGFFWMSGDPTGKNVYKANNCPDVSADGMIKLCKETGPISSIPDVPGLVVWKSGHIGVYVGNGYTIEMRGFAYDCVKRKVTDGPWTRWGRLPDTMLQYTDMPAPPVYHLGDRTLRKGDVGNDVKELQQALLDLGYKLPNYGADGDFGSETEAAVRDFQRKHNLEVDGIVGTKTYKALLAALAPEPEPPEEDTPDAGSSPAYVLVIEGDRIKLRQIQGEFGGKIYAEQDIRIVG